MPLYEIILDSGERQEVRLTDHPPSVGEILELHGTQWKIVGTLDPSEQGNTRFEARPAGPVSA